MKSTAILNADILDIIFENRNKSYGAYLLRKGYPRRLLLALGGTIIFIGLASIGLLFAKKNGSILKPDLSTTIFVLPPTPVEPPKEQPKPEQPKPKEQPLVKTQKFTKVEITDSPDDVTKLPDDLDNAQIGTKTQDGTAKPHVQELPVENPKPAADPAPAPEKPIDAITPVETAEIAPAYPGGMTELYKFLQRNLTNPEDLEEGQIISVRIKFIVGYNGELKGFDVIEDGGKAFNEEVIRVLKKMPKWIPGKTRGQNVSVYFTLPVKFVAGN